MLWYMEKYCNSIRLDGSGTYIAVLKPEYAIDGVYRVIKCDDVTGDLKTDRWVTINGSHVLIDDRTNKITAGMGGKFNGMKVGENGAAFKEWRNAANVRGKRLLKLKGKNKSTVSNLVKEVGGSRIRRSKNNKAIKYSVSKNQLSNLGKKIGDKTESEYKNRLKRINKLKSDRQKLKLTIRYYNLLKQAKKTVRTANGLLAPNYSGTSYNPVLYSVIKARYENPDWRKKLAENRKNIAKFNKHERLEQKLADITKCGKEATKNGNIKEKKKLSDAYKRTYKQYKTSLEDCREIQSRLNSHALRNNKNGLSFAACRDLLNRENGWIQDDRKKAVKEYRDSTKILREHSAIVEKLDRLKKQYPYFGSSTGLPKNSIAQKYTKKHKINTLLTPIRSYDFKNNRIRYAFY